MAFTAGKLALIALGNTNRVYIYDAQGDTIATVAAAGYFDNTNNTLNLLNEDIILALCSDGDAWFRYSSVSSGAVTLTMISAGCGPDRGVIGSASAAISVGMTELGTGTGTSFTGPTPYPGARLTISQGGTATGGKTVAVSSSGVTYVGGLTTITFNGQGQAVDMIGVSATRWRLLSNSGATFS